MNYFQKDKDYNLIPLKALFIITILLSLFFLINAVTDNKKISIVQKKEVIRIYSLKSNTSLYGGFILGTGKMDSNEYYVFFSKNESKGGYFKDKLPVKNTLLVEKDTIPHFIRNYAIQTTISTPYLWKKTVDIDTIVYSKNLLRRIPKNIGYEFIIVVPPGTITENQIYETL
ncbi:hypothetical protein [Elizabethkingia miricola]|uniref:hypothetical protein n=1 Tax=Elizabethkingia miricola TaxID=172045 RepID=UPI0009995052|nr:hypothetical protein [Elizabethkingia miricola]OPC29903.1 hypothetical protein BAX99_13080 [Elizabethkingia miricola]